MATKTTKKAPAKKTKAKAPSPNAGTGKKTNKHMKDFKTLSLNELTNKARELEADFFKARIEKTTGQLQSSAILWQIRKNIARVKTLMTAMSAGKE